MFIDSHCHLTAPIFAGKTAAVLEAARCVGVSAFVLPAVNFADCVRVLALCERESDCFAALGLHPFFAHSSEDMANFSAFVTEHQHHPKLVALGEMGLDSSKVLPNALELFTWQLDLAEHLHLPVILHARGCVDAVWQQLKTRQVRGIVHAFNGSLEQAKLWIQKDFLLGFGGVLSFENARKIHTLAKQLPLNAMVLETDAPDMRPRFVDQHLPNEPRYLPQLAMILAKLRGEDLANIAQSTSDNIRRVLALPLATCA